MKLYELTEKYNQLLEVAEGMDQDVLIDTLEALEGAIEEKAENTAKVVKSLESDVNGIAKEIKRLQAMKKSRENNITNLKNYLHQQLEYAGMDKVKGELFTVALQKNPSKLVVHDITKINKDYFIEQEPKLDNALLKDALKSGENVDGAELIQEKSLRIR